MPPPLRGCQLSHQKSSFWKTAVPFISHCFQNPEFPWGANLSDFLDVFQRPKRKFFRAPTARFYPLEMFKIRFRIPKFSRAYGALLLFRKDHNTVQNPKFFRAPTARRVHKLKRSFCAAGKKILRVWVPIFLQKREQSTPKTANFPGRRRRPQPESSRGVIYRILSQGCHS